LDQHIPDEFQVRTIIDTQPKNRDRSKIDFKMFNQVSNNPMKNSLPYDIIVDSSQ